MSTSLNFYQVAPETMAAMTDLSQKVDGLALERSLHELVKTRVSQINGCGFCLHMHTQAARKAGEDEMRLHVLAAWRETAVFSDRERAALAWAEALTRIATEGPPHALLPGLREQFSDKEIVDLTLLITTINAWNRIAIGFGTVPPKTWKIAA